MLPLGWHRGLTVHQVRRVLEIEAGGLAITPSIHEKGYLRVQLCRFHPYANSGGWQYLHRLIVMRRIGRRLEWYEHVHHANGAPKNTTDPRQLEILEETAHGRYHRGERLGCGPHIAA